MSDKIFIFEGLRLTRQQIDLLRVSRHGVQNATYAQNGVRRRTFDCLLREGLMEQSHGGLILTEKGRRAVDTVTYAGIGITDVLAMLRLMPPCERRLLHVCVGAHIQTGRAPMKWVLEQASRLGIPSDCASRVVNFLPHYLDAYQLR